MSEKEANKIYTLVLEKLIYPIIGNGITYSDDLKRFGLKLFGSKFCGVYSADKIPILNTVSKYAIINLDKSDQPGSHWISIALVNLNKIYIYDSFGRSTREILPEIFNKYKHVIMTDDDAEQHILQDDCGARCLSWIYVFDRYGSNLARLI